MSQAAGKPAPRPIPTGFRVLVVDDERALAALVGSYLTRDGFEVTMAHDGQEAIDLARQVDPDVMVLDLRLPVIDGIEVCRVVRTFSDCTSSCSPLAPMRSTSSSDSRSGRTTT